MMQVENIKCVDQVVTPEYAIYQGDSCEVIRAIPGDSIHFGIHSPPFEGMYKFSNFDRDMSNNEGGTFWEHYAFLIADLLRVTMPGRLHAVHCMQLPTLKIRNGHIGMRDFRGEIVRAYEDAGWIFHSEVCVWKDPVVAQRRTKSIRLLHKQIEKDSTISGQGLADYMLMFRKPGDNPEAVSGLFDAFVGTGLDISREAYDRHAAQTRAEGREVWPFDKWVSILVWQRYASPVWMDIDQTRTLQYRGGRDEKDEQHISPLQLDVIERCIDLWTNPGDVVLTPFLGIGSEVYCAVKMGRRGVGCELKPSYFRQAVKNLQSLNEERTAQLFRLHEPQSDDGAIAEVKGKTRPADAVGVESSSSDTKSAAVLSSAVSPLPVAGSDEGPASNSSDRTSSPEKTDTPEAVANVSGNQFVSRKTVLQPRCLRLDNCGGYGRNHCAACLKAMAESEVA